MNFDDIKTRHNLYDVATQRLGLKLRPVGNNSYRGMSIAPGEHTHDDALSIDAENGIWNDFTLGAGGDVLDLVAFKLFGNNDDKTLFEAAKFLEGDNFGSNHRFYGQYIYDQTTFLADIKKYHEALKTDEKTLEYLHSRRINDDTIERFMLGVGNLYNGVNGKEKRLVCPYLTEYGKPVYMVSRQLPDEILPGAEGGKYVKLKKDDKYGLYIEHTLYGLNTVPLNDKDCDTLIVGEGLFDALSAAQENYSILFFIGKPANKHIAQAVQIARKFRRIITVFDIDNNKSGQLFTATVGRELLKAGINFYCIADYGENNGKRNKDLSDFYTNGGSIQELFDSAINGYLFMAGLTFWSKTSQDLQTLSEYTPFSRLSKNEQLTMLSEIKKFVRALNNVTFDDVIGKEKATIIERLTAYYPSEMVMKFKEPPSAHELLLEWRDKFLDGRNIFFHGSIQGGIWFEYQSGGYWARLSDNFTQSKISKFFKDKLDNKTVTQLYIMLRRHVARKKMPEFNKQRLWSFRNGVFELDTGVLREPKPDDYLNWQVGYNYDENATCPVFDKFMNDVTCNEPSRIDFLLDMLGYILYEDNRLEKAFFLIGEGSNGKSTLLNVIEGLVSNALDGVKTFSTVQPLNFEKPVEVINLNGSIVNLVFELKSQLKGISPYFNSIVSGETISGNYKFCDTVDFKPRCKLICNSNRMLRVNDDTLGFQRRLMFCKFANSFLNNPDTKMKEKLKAELPGIFNKAYKAYRELLEREKTLGINAIRACVDQQEFITEFKQEANPVAAFWAENKEKYLTGGEVLKSTIFDNYKQYCERNGKFAGSENIFYRSLKRVTTDENISINEIRHKKGNSQPIYITFMNDKANELLDAEIVEADNE